MAPIAQHTVAPPRPFHFWKELRARLERPSEALYLYIRHCCEDRDLTREEMRRFLPTLIELAEEYRGVVTHDEFMALVRETIDTDKFYRGVLIPHEHPAFADLEEYQRVGLAPPFGKAA